MNNSRLLAEKMIKAALSSVDPSLLVFEQLKLEGDILTIQGEEGIDLSSYKNIYILGAGKGAAPMAKAVEELLGEKISGGFIVVKYGHTLPLKRIEVLEAGHPMPDKNSLLAGKKALQIAVKAAENDLVIVLLSGGGSSLLEALPQDISLKELGALNEALLGCGAAIGEINTVRKSLSLIKGGKLAEKIHPAKIITLILSDIIGDPPAMIASGPTVVGGKWDENPVSILEKYGLFQKLPAKIIKVLNKKADRPENAYFNVKNFIIGNNLRALTAAENIAKNAGYKTLLLSDCIEGESREVAKVFTGIIRSIHRNKLPFAPPLCILAGGETTVTLKGSGKGGRNQEMVLAALTEMGGVENPFYFCSIGTDGTDGPTDAAGAWIDEKSFEKAEKKGLNAESYLKNNDSYHFFNKLEQLIKTGPTKTNVMDIMFMLIERE